MARYKDDNRDQPKMIPVAFDQLARAGGDRSCF